MVHVDIKKVGRIPDGGGWRMHGRGSEHAKKVDRGKKRGTRTGYVYLHSIVDGFSRLAYTEALPDEKGVTAVGFINRAKAFFAAHGIARFTRVVTDNGSCYRSEVFARTLAGTRHQFIRPYTPRHNGKVERYNRILAEELLYVHDWTSETQRSEAIAVWNVHYNYRIRSGVLLGEFPGIEQFFGQGALVALDLPVVPRGVGLGLLVPSPATDDPREIAGPITAPLSVTTRSMRVIPWAANQTLARVRKAAAVAPFSSARSSLQARREKPSTMECR